MKKRSRKVRVNRCSGDNCSKGQKQQKGQKIKEVLPDVVQRERARREIKALFKQFYNRYSLLELLPLIKRQCSAMALRVALEMVERKQHELKSEDAIFLAKFKAEVEKSE